MVLILALALILALPLILTLALLLVLALILSLALILILGGIDIRLLRLILLLRIEIGFDLGFLDGDVRVEVRIDRVDVYFFEVGDVNVLSVSSHCSIPWLMDPWTAIHLTSGIQQVMVSNMQ
ncbi:hypothetical protein [Jannaschia seosinensis]|uniref:hypothetical protein n=1 Tax=Jannaschia seosinensis TaxID=313367 RepID=UPI001641FD97|nr:hypothetical protein [Jannaschia seosinensis]